MGTPYSSLPESPESRGRAPSWEGGDPGWGSSGSGSWSLGTINRVMVGVILVILIGGGTFAAHAINAFQVAHSGVSGELTVTTIDDCRTVLHSTTTRMGSVTHHGSTTSEACTYTGRFDSDNGTVQVGTAHLAGAETGPGVGKSMHVYKMPNGTLKATTGGSAAVAVLSVLVPLLLLAAVVVARVLWGRYDSGAGDDFVAQWLRRLRFLRWVNIRIR